MSRLEHSRLTNAGRPTMPIRMFHVKHTQASQVVSSEPHSWSRHSANQDTAPSALGLSTCVSTRPSKLRQRAKAEVLRILLGAEITTQGSSADRSGRQVTSFTSAAQKLIDPRRPVTTSFTLRRGEQY